MSSKSASLVHLNEPRNRVNLTTCLFAEFIYYCNTTVLNKNIPLFFLIWISYMKFDLLTNTFENISKPICFLGKAMKTCFVASLSSFLKNFELLKSDAYCQSCDQNQSLCFYYGIFYNGWHLDIKVIFFTNVHVLQHKSKTNSMHVWSTKSKQNFLQPPP